MTSDEVYAVTAYLRLLNRLVEEEEVMDAASLPQAEMPNRGGFVSDFPWSTLNLHPIAATYDVPPNLETPFLR